MLKRVKTVDIRILPLEILGRILFFLDYRTLADFRLISKQFNDIIAPGRGKTFHVPFKKHYSSWIQKFSPFAKNINVNLGVCNRSNLNKSAPLTSTHQRFSDDHSLIKSKKRLCVHDQFLPLHLLAKKKINNSSQFAVEYEKLLRGFADNQALRFYTIFREFFKNNIFLFAVYINTRMLIKLPLTYDHIKHIESLAARYQCLTSSGEHPKNLFSIIYRDKGGCYVKLKPVFNRKGKIRRFFKIELSTDDIKCFGDALKNYKKWPNGQYCMSTDRCSRLEINYVPWVSNHGSRLSKLTKCTLPFNDHIMSFLATVSTMYNLEFNPLLVSEQFIEFLEQKKNNLSLKSLIIWLDKHDNGRRESDKKRKADFIRSALMSDRDERFARSDDDLLNSTAVRAAFLRFCNKIFYLLYEIVKAKPDTIITIICNRMFSVFIDFYRELTKDSEDRHKCYDNKSNALVTFLGEIRILKTSTILPYPYRVNAEIPSFLFDSMINVRELRLYQAEFVFGGKHRALINRLLNLEIIEVVTMSSTEFLKMFCEFSSRGVPLRNALEFKIGEISVVTEGVLNKFIKALKEIKNKKYPGSSSFFKRNSITFYGNFDLKPKFASRKPLLDTLFHQALAECNVPRNVRTNVM